MITLVIQNSSDVNSPIFLSIILVVGIYTKGGFAMSMSLSRTRTFDLQYKVLVIGESAVGKTSLIRCYANPDQPFETNMVSTVGEVVIHLSVSPSICKSIHPSIYQFVHPFGYLFIHSFILSFIHVVKSSIFI